MTTSFTKSFEVPCSLETVFRMMKDESSLGRLMNSSYAQNPKFSVVSNDDGSTNIHIYREFEGDWPSFAQSHIGKTLEITEDRVWQSPAAGVCHGKTQVKALKDKALVNADLKILETGNKCTVSISGTVKVSINLFVDKIGEEIIKKEMLSAIDLEHEHYLTELNR